METNPSWTPDFSPSFVLRSACDIPSIKRLDVVVQVWKLKGTGIGCCRMAMNRVQAISLNLRCICLIVTKFYHYNEHTISFSKNQRGDTCVFHSSGSDKSEIHVYVYIIEIQITHNDFT